MVHRYHRLPSLTSRAAFEAASRHRSLTRAADTVLAAARAAGLNIRSGCTFGICGTCKIRKTFGEVHMMHNGGISEDDIDAGYIPACCSRPIGRIEVAV